MQPTHTQPHASPISDELVNAILCDALESGPEPYQVNRHGEFSNDVAVVTLASGRRMMVKRGRHPWSGERFSVARRASCLLRKAAGIVAPEPLELSPELETAPVEAYWRIELPLFADLWKDLDEVQRQRAMRSLGELMSRTHSAGSKAGRQLADVHPDPFSPEALFRDLTTRLRPAIAGEWPYAAGMLDVLVEVAPRLFEHAEVDSAVLHGDLHLGNVLCQRQGDEVCCVGLLDLEWVHAGPPESDFARFAVMHGGPFDMQIEPHSLEWVYEGYQRDLDRRLLVFYALYHYLNLGLYSAVIGDDWHAGAVAEAARPIAEELRAVAGARRVRGAGQARPRDGEPPLSST